MRILPLKLKALFQNRRKVFAELASSSSVTDISLTQKYSCIAICLMMNSFPHTFFPWTTNQYTWFFLPGKNINHNMTFIQYFLFIKLTFCLNGQFSSLYLMHTPGNTIRRFLLIVLQQFSSGHGCTGFAIILRRGIIDWAW